MKKTLNVQAVAVKILRKEELEGVNLDISVGVVRSGFKLIALIKKLMI
jgi:hypothetical protein